MAQTHVAVPSSIDCGKGIPVRASRRRIVRNVMMLGFLATVAAIGSSSRHVLAAENDEADFFERHVRPVLVEKCLRCHNDDEAESNLRLTSRAGLLAGGDSGPSIVAGDSRASLLIEAVMQSGELKMPPDERLTDAQIARLTEWINGGAVWPENVKLAKPTSELVVTDADREHWAFRPIADPPAPQVNDDSWPVTPIDRFILARLEAAGLARSPEADRRTLARRAYFDLHGLPPTWDELKKFVDDPRPTEEAFSELVDRLLDSPRYGERWGRHWLDVARFADTKDGVLMYGDDRIRPFAYTYRDYVIRAFNEDLPFDRFVHEQIAADSIEPAVEPWRLAAMGFLTLGRMYDNNVHDVIDDQIDTIGRGLLGLTISCARCHDHKYDPVPMADYYSLYGVFASSVAPLELPLIAEPASVPGGDEFEKSAAPKREELRKFLDDQFNVLSETARRRTPDYLVRVATTEPDPLETAIYFLSLAPDDLRPPIVARWRERIRERARADDPVFGPWSELMALPTEVESPSFAERAAEAIERWIARPIGTEPGQLNPIVAQTLRDMTAKTPDAKGASLGDRAAVARMYGELLVRQFNETAANPSSDANGDPLVAARRQLLELIDGPSSPNYFPKSQTRRYMSRSETDAFGGKVQELDRMAVQSPNAPPRAMVLNEAPQIVDPCIFIRGNPTRPGRDVPRQFLAIASREQSPFGVGSGRLELARAITSPDNPLTARVIVNRVWMHHFGEPLVSTPGDFGRRATPPTHPELLDHLAATLVRDGWSLKRLHRRIMLSKTYQQSSSGFVTDESGRPAPHPAAEVDHDNRLLWRMNRRRLEFEAMRDTLLAIAGRLEHRGAGRPIDIAGDPQSRCRTVYGLVDRQSLPGMFRAFDFASPDQSVDRRPRTIVPQQALFALNSPFVVEQAKGLAATTAPSDSPGSSDSSSTGDLNAKRVTAMFRDVFGREPTADEIAAASEFVGAANENGTQLTRWEQLAQVLLASNELMYVD